MAKRRANKPRNESSADAAIQEGDQIKESEKATFITSYYQIEHRINAMRAICDDAEIAHLLNQLHLMRSYFSKEQLDTPLVDFLKEKCPNVSLAKTTEDGEYELDWKTSTKYPDHEDLFPGNGGFEFSSKAVRETFLRAASMHIPDFVCEENWNSRMVGLHDSLQTPGVTSQRLSVGTTPKTLRLPKHGEMLLSVHGSPLGVYREGGMEVINESGGTRS